MKIMEFNKIFGAATAALLVYLLANYFSGELYAVEKPRELAYALEIESDEPAEEGGDMADEGGMGGGVQLASLLQEASADDGAKIFRKCSACHKVEEGVNAVGPSLWNVVGRPVQSIEDYGYSGALAETGAEVWSFENLYNFIENPKEWAPGTSMGYAGLEDPEDRADVLVYLNQAGDDPQPLPEPEAAPEPEPAAEEMAEAEPAAEETAEAEPAAEADAPAEEQQVAAADAVPAEEMADDADGAREVEQTEETEAPAEGEATSEQVAAMSDEETAETGGGEDAQDATQAARAMAEEDMPEEVEPVEAEAAPMTFANALEVVSASEGEQVFQQCAACHRLAEGEHGIAPSLHGIVGREVAAAPYFPYSDALSALDGAWTPARLNDYLKDPAAYAPGNHMAFHGLDSARDRAAVVAYLNEQGGDPIDLVAAVRGGGEEGGETMAAISEATGDVVETVEETAETAAETVAEEGGELVESAEDTVESAAETVADEAPEVVDAAEDAAADAAEAVEESVESAAETVAEEAPKVVEEAEEAATDAAETVAETAEDAAEAVTEEASDVVDAAEEAVSDATEMETAALSEEQPEAPAEEAAAPAAAGGVAAGVSPEFASALQAASADDGEGVFRKCAACHKLDEGKHAVGPSLYGVIGREVASAEGFRYSKALQGIGGVWTYEKLNQYLTNPRKYAKGTKMAFAGLRDIEDRADVVTYLNEADGSPEPIPQP